LKPNIVIFTKGSILRCKFFGLLIRFAIFYQKMLIRIDRSVSTDFTLLATATRFREMLSK